MDNRRRTPISTAYILSAGRSGSTLLDLLLGKHEDAFSVGEVTHLPKNIALNTACMCGAPVRECPAWLPVIEKMSELLGVDVLADPYAMNLGFIQASRVIDHRKMTRFYELTGRTRHAAVYASRRLGLGGNVSPVFNAAIENTRKLFDVIRETQGVRTVVDASKAYLKGIALYESAPRQTRLILLTRDGRGVINSEIRSGSSVRSAVRSWRNYYTRTLALLKRVPSEHVIRVRYEELATDPERELRRIAVALGLDYDASMMSTDRIQHIANGNHMRFAVKPVRLDTRWHDELPPEALTYFESAAGPLNRRLAGSAERPSRAPRLSKRHS